MDLKKIKPNDVLGYLDELVAKIPESISSVLTKVMIGILVICVCYAAYYGYLNGYGSATQEGQELAKDTKSLFLEDIEREYNRKRKNIRMPSAENLLNDEIYKTPKQYEAYGRQIESNKPFNSDDSLLENNKGLRSFRRSENTSPLAELNDTPPNPESPSAPQPNENSETILKPRRKLQLKDSFDNPLSNSDNKEINSVLDRVNTDTSYSKKILNKRDSSFKKKDIKQTPPKEESDSTKEESNLIVPETPVKKEKRGKLIPIDGLNE